MGMSVDCSGELNPIVSPTESSRVGKLGPSPLLVALLSSPGCGSSGRGCSGPAAVLGGDKVLSPCVPNKPAGGSQLWLSGVTRKGRRGACRSSQGTKGLLMPGRCGACRCPGEVLARISAEKSRSYSGRSCTPRSSIGLFEDWPDGWVPEQPMSSGSGLPVEAWAVPV
jgi:hypothetical protein